MPSNDEEPRPELVLSGHSKEGYGMSWNDKKPGYLLSGGYDGKLIIWNVEAATEKYSTIQPLQ